MNGPRAMPTIQDGGCCMQPKRCVIMAEAASTSCHYDSVPVISMLMADPASACSQMTEVALLIFDEAHHAVKRHPYNLIMQEFYHQVSMHSCLALLGCVAR